MSLIKYPTALKKPLLANLKFAQTSNLLRTQMGSGRARQRARFLSVPTIMQATWKLKPPQARIFEGFISDGLKGASAWFLMDIPTPNGLQLHQVRFTESPLQSFSFNGSFWTYQAAIEIKKYKAATEEHAAKELTAPHSLSYIADELESTLKQS